MNRYTRYVAVSTPGRTFTPSAPPARPARPAPRRRDPTSPRPATAPTSTRTTGTRYQDVPGAPRHVPLLHGVAERRAAGADVAGDERQRERRDRRDRDRGALVARHPRDADRTAASHSRSSRSSSIRSVGRRRRGSRGGRRAGAAPRRRRRPRRRVGLQRDHEPSRATASAPPATRTERVIAVPGGWRSNLSKLRIAGRASVATL